MSKQSARNVDQKKVSTELFTLTYGALVAQILKDFETDEEVNKQLDKMGFNIGYRIVEEFLARTNIGRCKHFQDTAEVIAKQAFKMFLGITPLVTNVSPDTNEFSLVLESNPLTEFVELPEGHSQLNYSNILAGAIRGALQNVQLDVDSYFVQDQLRGDALTEIRVKFNRRIKEISTGED